MLISGGLSALATLHVLTHEVLLIVAAGIAISSLDGFALDLIYFGRRAWRAGVVYRRHRPLRVENLPCGELGWMASIVPAWDEAAVIGAMPRNLTSRLDYSHYRVFVGVYPKDPATAAAIAAVGDPRITTVGCSRPGPTTKADCLNHLWRAVLAAEIVARQRYKAIVLHDAEGVVHARELAIFDHLIPRLAMVSCRSRCSSTAARGGSAVIISTSSPRRTPRIWSSARRSARRCRARASPVPLTAMCSPRSPVAAAGRSIRRA